MARSFSLLVSTRNRAAQLAVFLRRLDILQLTQAGGELIVVDNGSADGTAQVLADYAGHLGRQQRDAVTLAHEPAVGLAHARNSAMALATSDLFCFTDD